MIAMPCLHLKIPLLTHHQSIV